MPDQLVRARVAPRPEPAPRTARQRELARLAAAVLEKDGPEGLTMRRLGAELGIRAPSLYKHLSGKAEMLAWLVEDGLFRAGDVCHAAVDDPGRRGPIHVLLAAYRNLARATPHQYRLLTGSVPDRPDIPAGLRVWGGEPFWRVTGEPHLAQALWAFAHGTAVLEIDSQFLDPAELDLTWQAGADAFAAARRGC